MADGVLGEETNACPSMAGQLGSRGKGNNFTLHLVGVRALKRVHESAGRKTKDRNTITAHKGWREGRPPFREVCGSPSRSPGAAEETCASGAC